MLIIGLTGSIGMGKSTAATRFRELGVPVADADAIVHELYRGRAVPLVEAAFPGSTRDGVVDRQRLSAALLADPKRFKQLEAVVHPLVHEVQRAFIDDAAAHGKSLIVLENPLLIEMGGHTRVDVVVVVSARPEQQRERVLARPGMSPEKFAEIVARQTPDDIKRALADFVVDTSGTIEESRAQVDKIVENLKGRSGEAFAKHWSLP